MKYKKYLKQMKNNIVTHPNLYRFRYALLPENCSRTVNLENNNPCLLYGAGIPVFEDGYLPNIIDDIAYEENGKLFHIITNDEIKKLEPGLNTIENGTIYAASESIKKVTKGTLEHYVDLMKDETNICYFYSSYYKKRINHIKENKKTLIRK